MFSIAHQINLRYVCQVETKTRKTMKLQVRDLKIGDVLSGTREVVKNQVYDDTSLVNRRRQKMVVTLHKADNPEKFRTTTWGKYTVVTISNR